MSDRAWAIIGVLCVISISSFIYMHTVGAKGESAGPATPFVTPSSETNLDGTPRVLPPGISLEDLCAQNPAPSGYTDPACG
jgi:hypothetical protein